MVAAREGAGVRRIALVGSIVTIKPIQRNIDVLVAVADDAERRRSRRMRGGCRAMLKASIEAPDVFLADE